VNRNHTKQENELNEENHTYENSAALGGNPAVESQIVDWKVAWRDERNQCLSWDGVPIPFVSSADLDLVAFRWFRKKALSKGRLTEEDLNITDEELIHSLDLFQGKYLKRAAVLLFHEKPEKWVNGAFVKIGYFESDDDLLYQDEIHGPILLIPDKVEETIYLKYFKGIISYEGLQRIETFPVPRAAMREAVLNAVVHRDYSTEIPIQIKIFPDKVIIYNDGRLPEDWTIEDLLSTHRSRPFNPKIASVFFRSGMIETWGRGIERIITACKRANKPMPKFEIKHGNEFTVTFYTDSIITENVIANEMQRQINRPPFGSRFFALSDK